MAYGRNPKVITKVEPALKLLLSADSELVIPSKDPTKLAYYLYNAIWLASELKKEPYDKLEGKWKFKAIVKEGKVVCRPKHDALVMIDEVEIEAPDDSMEIVGKIMHNTLVKKLSIHGVSLLTYEEVKSWADLNNIHVAYSGTNKLLTIYRHD